MILIAQYVLAILLYIVLFDIIKYYWNIIYFEYYIKPHAALPVGRRREHMVGVNMLGVSMAFHDAICGCFEGAMLEPCLLKPCFHVAGSDHLRGNHLSNTTCLTRAFFKSGEECSTLWCSLTRRKTHKTSMGLY